MLLKCAFPIIAYTTAILSGIYVANYLLFRIGLNEWYLPFAPPPHLPSAGISYCFPFLLAWLWKRAEKKKKKSLLIKSRSAFPGISSGNVTLTASLQPWLRGTKLKMGLGGVGWSSGSAPHLWQGKALEKIEVFVEEGLGGLQLLWNCSWGLDFPACLSRCRLWLWFEAGTSLVVPYESRIWCFHAGTGRGWHS